MSVAIANPSVAAAPALLDGDDSFTNVNMKLSRELLPPGTLALSVNKRLRFGSADTRNGCRCVVNMGIVLSGSGIGIDRRSGEEVLSILMAETNEVNVKVFNPNTAALATNVTTTGFGAFGNTTIYEFAPGFGETIMTARIVDPGLIDLKVTPLVWDGAGTHFAALVNSTPGDTSTTTTSTFGAAEVVENRLIFQLSRYAIAWTLINDYTRYDPIYDVANIKRDVGGALSRVFPTLNKQVVLFKTQSILLLRNFTGNLGSSTTPPPFSIEDINPAMGCNAPQSVVQVGADIIFLSATHKGIFRLGEVIQDRLAALPDPVSLPLQPLIDRINWPYAGISTAPGAYVPGGACAATIGEYVFFAVPIDGSTVNNCVIVLNAATNALEGYDIFGAATQFDRLFVLPANGTPQLYGVDHANGRIWLMYDDTLSGAARHDVFPSGNVAIADTIETRGYATPGLNGAATRRKKFKRARVALATQSPSVTLTAVADGVNEAKVLRPAPITRSPSKSMLFDDDGSNAGAPLQEDYASGATQESIVRRNVDMSGRWLSVRIANTQGTCNVRSVHLEAKPLPNMTEAGA